MQPHNWLAKRRLDLPWSILAAAVLKPAAHNAGANDEPAGFSPMQQAQQEFCIGSAVVLHFAMALNRGHEYSEIVHGRSAGLRVLSYLAATYRHSSVEEWRRRIAAGLVLLDQRPTSPDAVLQPGQSLIWRRPPWEEPDAPLCYALLYRDRSLLAAAKPAGLPTLPAGGFLQHTLLSLVRKTHPEATPVHRLGRGTSGVLLFARTLEARRKLHSAFRNHAVSKTYRALASGRPDQDEFTIDAPIGPVPHARLGLVYAASAAGRRALTRVRVVERHAASSLLEIAIETGKPHQIRIHLAVAGHPLVGDPLYTVGGGFKEDGATTTLPGEIGYWLHAAKIALAHPADGSSVEIYCRPPPLLRAGSC